MNENLIHYQTGLEVNAGKLLISEPLLREQPFQRSVIFLCHHDASESVGYILNKKAGLELADFIPALEGSRFPLYDGGPVGNDTLHLLHTVHDLLGGDAVMPGIYWGGNLEKAIQGILRGLITPEV